MTAHHTAPVAGTGDSTAISDRLDSLVGEARAAAGESAQPAVSLEWVLAQLHERAFGLFLLILALPCCIPFLYGIPQVVALPLMFVSAQILAGRRTPWLPRRLAERTVAVSGLEGLSLRAGPWLRRIEAISRPRLAALTRAPADRLVGLALVLFSASILVPLPGTNTVPGFAVVVVAMGLLQRDGLLVILGAILGTAWIATLIFAGATLVSVLRAWIGI
ncbi:exopolysaccharide biosynthesis protein [Sagittula sp. SSi028]|uniref:exopolysaccharide biosynthesis protein n=1 Tax=Sagittula sp. SSi028 TaxID=3400636 RepID=UPI003AF54D78